MLPAVSPQKKPKSPGIDLNINLKTSVTCTNVPESLFDPNTVKKHFSKFGRVQKIRLFPKRSMCIIEYDQPISAERAVLNAGAFDGFMFDVTRTKSRIRRKSKKEDDPDWVPDSDVEEELNAMSGAPSYRLPRRSKPMEQDSGQSVSKTRTMKLSPLRKGNQSQKKMFEKPPITSQPTSGTESPVLVKTVQTSLSTAEAAAELHQLKSRISVTPDEQWRTLDARDRILRAWGGAGSRVKVGGATIGTCPDMCPEKELLHRQAEHQVMTLETVQGSDGLMEPWRAVKQYSRSSADQEIPMCYELRPAPVLMRTCSYLLHEIADTTRQVTLADWFHFMWDRLRSIRKDITQQALCCEESICLVEMCARFHAHCAARLADLEHTQFDQKLNTDNLTKCLQTLKHMYADVDQEKKPNEAEFRGYIALLNLGDSNFWWEIKQLPQHIQKSKDIAFAIQIFNALDNNNYVRFFRLVHEKATYLQACILLRYFNDVRARALARMVKAYAPRGGSRFPAEDLMNALAFETIDSMKLFISHYGLRISKTDNVEIAIVLDRNQFIEDSDPYPVTRAIELIESKRVSTVSEVIAGGRVSRIDYEKHIIYSSFDKDGKIKSSALIAEDQAYNTTNDTNKDVNSLKIEIQRLAQGSKVYSIQEKPENKTKLFEKFDDKSSSAQSINNFATSNSVFSSESKLFSFTPAIPVASTEILKDSPEKFLALDVKNVFSFSKPQDSFITNESKFKTQKEVEKVFTAPVHKSLLEKEPVSNPRNVFSRLGTNKDLKSSDNVFCDGKSGEKSSIFAVNVLSNKPENVFGKLGSKNTDGLRGNSNNDSIFGNKSIFSGSKENIFTKTDDKKLETSSIKTSSIFSKAITLDEKQAVKNPSNIFGTFAKSDSNVFTKPATDIFKKPVANGDNVNNNLSPGSLFKSVALPPVGVDPKIYSIFQSKNKAQTVADNILNSVNDTNKSTIYEFNEHDHELKKQGELHDSNEEKLLQERIIQQKLKDEEERKQKELLRQEEEKRKEEIRRKEEELKKREEIKKQELKSLEEKRKKEEKRKQEELKRKLEEERKAALQRKAEEEKKFQEAVEKESTDTVEELTAEVIDDTLCSILKEEAESLKKIVKYAEILTEHIIVNLNNEICENEMKAEMFWTKKVMKTWFYLWRKNYIRNCKRRTLLEDVPVWLTEKNPLEEALIIRRPIENAALKNMNAIHKGYKFTGELKSLPPPDPYNLMEVIRSPLLKRMKQINYPYDKCFFWKASIVLSESKPWIYKKLNLEQWIISAFSDNQKHEYENLIHVGKQSWNHLMDFAISICLTEVDKLNNCTEALEGSNGILFYFTEKDNNIFTKIETVLKHIYQYQVIPVTVIVAKCAYISMQEDIEKFLSSCVETNVISAFKIFIVDPENLSNTFNNSTKSALKWMAKKCPPNPPLDIDSLKSICQRYLGNEIWCKLKVEHDNRMNNIIKDLNKLITCYNIAVDRLTDVLTNEDYFNYMPFPLEFKKYLDDTSPYPKPYEFIPSRVKTEENILAIKNIMSQLKLPLPTGIINLDSNRQQQVEKYCHQIGWFNNPQEVICKVVTSFSESLFDSNISDQDLSELYAQCDLINILNIIVYEKIRKLDKFDNRFAIYEKSVLQDYSNANWLYETKILREINHKAIECDDDDVDYFIEAKRRKIAIDSIEYLTLEDKDQTLIDESISAVEKTISIYNDCSEAVMQLERQLEDEKKKSIEFENMLKAALYDV